MVRSAENSLPKPRLGGTASVREPDLMTGAHFRRDRRELDRQVLHQRRTDRGLQLGRKLGAPDQTGTVKADIQITENIPGLQATRPFLQPVQLARRVRAADHRADRGADDHVGDNAMRNQGPDNTDMGKSARGPAAKRQPDHRPADGAQAYLILAFRAALTSSDQNFQHVVSPGPEAIRYGVACQNLSQA
jgi:hypothetical protein